MSDKNILFHLFLIFWRGSGTEGAMMTILHMMADWLLVFRTHSTLEGHYKAQTKWTNTVLSSDI